MRIVNIQDAKTHLSKLVEEVSKGEEIIIAKASKPMARLVPIRSGQTYRRPGLLAGKFSVPEDFDAPLPEDVITSFEGRGDTPPRGHACAALTLGSVN